MLLPFVLKDPFPQVAIRPDVERVTAAGDDVSKIAFAGHAQHGTEACIGVAVTRATADPSASPQDDSIMVGMGDR